MNKFLSTALLSLCILLLIGSKASSQVMIIMNNNGDTLNGTEVTVDGVYTSTSMLYSASVVNNSAGSLVVNCRRHVVEKVTGTGNYFCWGTQWYGESVNVGNAPDTIPSGQVNESFHGYFKPYNIGGVNRIRYVFYDVNTPSDSVFFTVKFNCTLNTSGFSDLNTSGLSAELYPTATNDAITVRADVPVFSVSLFDLSGRSLSVSGTSFSGSLRLDVASLPAGMYRAIICDATGNKKSVKTFIRR